MADNFSFESNPSKKYLLSNFSNVNQEELLSNPLFQKIIKVFDQDGDGNITAVNSNRKNEWNSVFKELKKYAGSDGILTDAELEVFIKSNSNLENVTPDDIKKFVEISQAGYISSSAAVEDLRKSLPKTIFTGYSNDDGYYVSVTEIRENDVLVRKEEIIHSNPPMEKTSYYKDGNLDYVRILATQDGFEMEHFVQYENDKPSFALSKVNGVEAFSVVYKEEPEKKVNEKGESIETGEMLYYMQVMSADGSVRYITASEIDENGQVKDEDIKSMIIQEEDGVRAYNKFPFLANDGTPTDNYYFLESYISNDEKFKYEIAYNTDVFSKVGTLEANKLSHVIERDGQIYEIQYDGNGNTYLDLQYDEGVWDLYKDFNTIGMDWDSYKTNWEELNPDATMDVGSRILVLGEYAPDHSNIVKRDSSEVARQKYQAHYFEYAYKTSCASDIGSYSLEKNYSRLWDLAKDILINEYGYESPSNNEINKLMHEILIVNSDLDQNNLKAGLQISYPTAKRVDDSSRERLEKLGFEANQQNNTFYVRIASLSSEQQKIAIDAIEKYRELGKTDKEIKHLLLNEYNINVFDSGRSAKLNTKSDEFFLSTVLDASKIKELGSVKYGIEEIVTDIVGLELDSEEGMKLYKKLLTAPDEALSRIPFGLLKDYLSDNPTCSEVENLVEELTLFTSSIRFNDDGSFDKKGYEANFKKERTELPKVIKDYLQYAFNLVLDNVRAALKTLEANENVPQEVLNWFAERIEACGLNTDNKKDVLQALQADAGKVLGIATDPDGNFKSLVGKHLSYENIINVLKGEYLNKLKSNEAMTAVAGNYDTYDVAFKAIEMGIATALAIITAPFTGGGSLAFLGNVAWVSLAAGIASGTADGILSNGQMSLEEGWDSIKGGMFFGATVSTCNLLGSNIMATLFPKHIVSGTAFNEMALGNTYCGSFFTRAGLYVTESALQSTAQYFTFNNGQIIPLDYLSTSTFAAVAAFFGTKTAVQAYRGVKSADAASGVAATVNNSSKAFDDVAESAGKVNFTPNDFTKMSRKELESAVAEQAETVQNLVVAGGGVAFMNWLVKSKLVNTSAKIVPTTFDAKVRYVNGEGKTIHHYSYRNPDGEILTVEVTEYDEDKGLLHKVEVKSQNLSE